ncbi:MAG: hypothetical protein ABI644_07400 [Arenimonas sp.]
MKNKRAVFDFSVVLGPIWVVGVTLIAYRLVIYLNEHYFSVLAFAGPLIGLLWLSAALSGRVVYQKLSNYFGNTSKSNSDYLTYVRANTSNVPSFSWSSNDYDETIAIINQPSELTAAFVSYGELVTALHPKDPSFSWHVNDSNDAVRIIGSRSHLVKILGVSVNSSRVGLVIARSTSTTRARRNIPMLRSSGYTFANLANVMSK